MKNKKLILLFIVIIALILLLFFINIMKGKGKDIFEDTNLKNELSNNYYYEYDDSIGMYVIYDSNGEEYYRTSIEENAIFIKDNPNIYVYNENE